MKRKQYAVLAVVSLFLLLCTSLFGCSSVVGNGQITTKEISLPQSFNGAKTTSPIDIVLDASISGNALLEGESNMIGLVDITDEDGLLVVSYKQGTMALSTRPVVLRIPYFGGGVLETSSSGNISMAGGEALKGDKYNLRVNSTGSIHLEIEAEEVNARTSSDGSITVSGSADKAFIELSSTGSFHGFDFILQNARVQVSSLGSAEVNVTGELTGQISSLGGITYDGNPSKVNISGGSANKR
jgi:hypothetical protein